MPIGGFLRVTDKNSDRTDSGVLMIGMAGVLMRFYAAEPDPKSGASRLAIPHEPKKRPWARTWTLPFERLPAGRASADLHAPFERHDLSESLRRVLSNPLPNVSFPRRRRFSSDKIGW